MFLHLGSQVSVWEPRIIGIFSHKSTMPSKITQEFMEHAEKKRLTRKVNNDPPKSFVLTDKGIFLSPIDSVTLKGRMKNKQIVDCGMRNADLQIDNGGM